MSFHVFPTLQPDYCSQIATDMSYVTFAQFLLLLGRYALKKSILPYWSLLVHTPFILPLTAKPLPAVLGSLVANHL